MSSLRMAEVLCFGDYRLDVRRRVLYRRRKRIPLEPKPVKALIQLAQNQGRLVSRDDLYRHVWGESRKTTKQNSLDVIIHKIRVATKDLTEPFSIIGTDPGIGYRLIPDVSEPATVSKHDHVADKDLVESAAQAYLVEPASADDVSWAADLATRVYSRGDALPKSVKLEWYEQNPSGFFIIKNRRGDRLGNLDVLPLKPRTLSSFVMGEIIEREIRGDCLYPPSESTLIEDLYIESLVCVTHPNADRPRPNAVATVRVLAQFSKIAKNICRPRNMKQLYAIAASSNGSALLTRFGFSIKGEALSRRDKHDLYWGRFVAVARLLYESIDQTDPDEEMLAIIAADDSENGD